MDDINLIKWYVDGSYLTHPDIKSHTGGYMTFVEGMLQSKYYKQKFNRNSSTDTKVLSVDNVLPSILYTKYFLECQGYTLKETINFRDNETTIFLENNCSEILSKRTNHINVRYSFIFSIVMTSKIKIKNCGTRDIMDDFFMKLFQVKTFLKFREMILVIIHR